MTTIADTSPDMLLQADLINQSRWEPQDSLPPQQIETSAKETAEMMDESSIEARLFLICTHSGTEVIDIITYNTLALYRARSGVIMRGPQSATVLLR